MIGLLLYEIEEKDIKALIDEGRHEDMRIEYKRVITDEFYAAVSSFANAAGGDLLIGVAEEKGLPKDMVGIDIEDVDKEKLKLKQKIDSNIAPRIPSLDIKEVALSNGKYVLIIRIQKSWAAPHQVVGKGVFYTRRVNGKNILNVDELRYFFTQYHTIFEKIKFFRNDRVSNVYSGNTPVIMGKGPKTIVHVIPLSSFSAVQHYDLDRVSSDRNLLRPLFGYGWYYRYNIDGLLSLCGKEENSPTYVQLLRNGVIEAVNLNLLDCGNGTKVIPQDFENGVWGDIAQYLKVLQKLSIEPPIYIFLTLLNVKGFEMGLKARGVRSRSIDRDVLFLPEIELKNYEEEIAKVLKPCYDALWNACGFDRSWNYNKEGNWEPKSY